MAESGSDITRKAIFLPTNGAVRTSVSTTPEAIGFISLGYVDNTIKSLTLGGYACTIENCKQGKYPIVRPLYFLTRREPTGLVKEFIDFCISMEGQEIVKQEGFISIK